MGLVPYRSTDTNPRFELIFEIIMGYGLGASTVALFSRVGGGIYTRAAEIGQDLYG